MLLASFAFCGMTMLVSTMAKDLYDLTNMGVAQMVTFKDTLNAMVMVMLATLAVTHYFKSKSKDS